ncbi:MAG: S9 family peptidase [Marinilabiliaceae bacterium]|nr:S9 family peptidase [Marinilabiliaceae bacterium]
MKSLLFISVLLLVLGGCTIQKPGKGREVPAYSIEAFYENISVHGGSFSADESKLLVTSNKSGIFNAYKLPLDGTAMDPLTHSTEESMFAISYFPEDDRILISSDKGGNEINHIFMRDTDGTITDLTPWETAKSNFYGWSRDQKSFFFISNKRDARYFDLYEMGLEFFESRLLFENNDGYDIGAISHDKNRLVLTKSITTSRNEMFLFKRDVAETIQISPENADATFNPQQFSLNDNEVFYLTNNGAEFTFLSKYNLESGEVEKVYETDWDVWYAYHSWNEKYRVIGVNQDARTVVRIINMETGAEVDFPSFPDGTISGVSISKSEKFMKFSLVSSKMPANIYLYEMENGKYKRLTNTLNPDIDPNNLVDGQVVRYPSFDGLEIPAVLYKPHQADGNQPVPALVWVHGGPGGQSRVGYFSLIQYLVNHGYAILAVNNRGSSGYGKSFHRLDDRNHGEGDLQDCVYGKNYLSEMEWVDSSKIGIIGGSYGGYMVMAALTFTPDEFDAGVNIFGVTNWLRTLKSIPPWWESFRGALYKEMGDPTTIDSVRLYNISPLFHAQKVTKPLMVLQGANDPRVLQVESDEIVKAVKSNGVPVEYVLFPDEGHGFVKKENEIKGYGQILVFLDKNLKGFEQSVK